MLISVITVTLNPGKLLQSTIESVVSQSSRSWEMVIQDGGSTDGSLDELEENSRIRIVREKDEGIYDAMNRALAQAHGDYLLFLNAGDCFASSSLVAEVLAEAEEKVRPDLIFCDYRNVSAGKNVCLPDKLDVISLFRAVYCHQAVFFSRRLFDEFGGYDTSYSIRADLEFLYRCHSGKPSLKVSRVPRCGILYEGSGFSAEAGMQTLKAEELKKIRLKYLPKWQVALFTLLHELTLVRLRNWWFRRSLQVS